MTVTAVAPVQPRMWRGYDDPGLPVGAYISLGLVVGDVSGGTMQVEHQFKLAGDAGSARWYNIEQLNVFSTELLQAAGHIIVVGFEDLPTVNVTVQRWVFTLVADGGSFTTTTYGGLPTKPLFIGQSTPDATVLAAVRVGTPNAGAGIVMQSVIQGYIWEARSAQAPGGLRRPLDALYG